MKTKSILQRHMRGDKIMNSTTFKDKWLITYFKEKFDVTKTRANQKTDNESTSLHHNKLLHSAGLADPLKVDIPPNL